MRSSGCGPTSAAMAITKLTGERITPIITAEYALANGYRTEDSGTLGTFFAAIGKEYGLIVKETTNFYEAKKILKDNSKSIVVASMKGPGPFTRSSGHYIVLDSTKTVTTHVLCPNVTARNHYWWDLEINYWGNIYYIFTKPN
ncbi:MAG: hypothetical protein GX075_00390 [Firmicutes bacterium]|nr:hypothetical protein [Bacillota bacterium]